MKNRICLIIPYVGVFPGYFELFLHSISKNKDILDLLILIPDNHTPELKTIINFKLPENVFVKEVNFIEVLQIFQEKLSEIFNHKVDLTINEYLSIIKRPYSLCHYKCFLNLVAQGFLQGYSHWGFTDCDLILGNILSFYPNIFEIDCLTDRGQFGLFRNEQVSLEAYRGVNTHLKGLCEVAFKYFVNQEYFSFAGDESWTIKTVQGFYQQQKKVTPTTLVQKCITPMWRQLNGRDYSVFTTGNGFTSTIQGNHIIPKIIYKNGDLSFLCNDKEYPIIYAHFMTRTKLCINTINIINYQDSINFEILPPLTFNELP